MKTVRQHLLISFVALAMGGVAIGAQAQTPPPEGRFSHAANQEQRQAKMAEFFAKRQAKLHDLLKLTAAQEGAWTTYQAAIKPTPPAAGAHPDRAAIAAMSAPARLAEAITMSKAHTAKMESLQTALTAFYGTLTADQKKIFDDNTMGGAHGGHGMRGRMMHH